MKISAFQTVGLLLVAALLATLVPLLALAQTDRTDRQDRVRPDTEQLRISDVTLGEEGGPENSGAPAGRGGAGEDELIAPTSGMSVHHTLRGRDGRAARFVEGEVIVKLAGDERPRRVSTQGRGVREAATALASLPNVEYAEPNYIAQAFMVPNDPFYSPYQWNFDNDTSGGINAEAAWDSANGNGVVVAIIDTGIAYEYRNEGRGERYYEAPDLAGTTFVPGFDFVNSDTHPNDDNGHGTHVAGTIAGATNNGQGVAGLAYGASLMPVKVLDSRGGGTYADVADGIRFAADNGADVINLSLGGPVGASYLEEALAYAHGKGVTIVAASGNDGENEVSYPAAYDEYVIAVGATRFDESVTGYSNTGAALDLVAPGGDTSIDQNGDGYGDGILQQTFGRSTGDFSYYFYQGTSMAAPHVAAGAALVLSAGKATTPGEVQALLESTAKDLGASGWDSVSGHGLIDLGAALSASTPIEPEPEPVPEPEPEPTPNTAPVADAGPDQTLTDSDDSGGETVVLNGTGSSDSDGTITSYDWSEGGTALGSGATINVPLTVGIYTITLTVTDDDGATDTDTVTITVEAAPAPEPEPEPDPDPAPAPGTAVFTEDFEDRRLTGWTQDGQEAWRDSRREAYDGDASASVDGDAVNAALISPNIDLGGTGDVEVHFAWFIEDNLDNGEYLAFDLSTDGGASWSEQARLRGQVDPTEVWQTATVSLADVSQLRLRFRGTMSSAVEDAYIDAIEVMMQ